VPPGHRQSGIATKLATACLAELKRRGINNVFSWARAGGEVVTILEQHGFARGHEYVWMDRAI